MTDALIRPASPEDLPGLVDIFNHYVRHGHVTFETVPYTVDSRRRWFERYGAGRHRLLVATLQGQVLGCTYSSPYRPTPAFETTVETSIYLHPDHRGRGTGLRLYTALFELLAQQDVDVAVAAVALPNPGSLALHRRMGFTEVGTFREYARKNGAWISSTWFQRPVR